MSSILDRLEQYFTGKRDKRLVRSKHDYSTPVYIHGWRVVIPTKPTELFTAYFLWPSFFCFFSLFLPLVIFAHHPYPVHSRFASLADAERLAGNNAMATLYTMLDMPARSTPYFAGIFNVLVQLLLLYNLLTMYFWNRRARRIQAHPLPAPSPMAMPNVWPPPPTI